MNVIGLLLMLVFLSRDLVLGFDVRLLGLAAAMHHIFGKLLRATTAKSQGLLAIGEMHLLAQTRVFCPLV